MLFSSGVTSSETRTPPVKTRWLIAAGVALLLVVGAAIWWMLAAGAAADEQDAAAEPAAIATAEPTAPADDATSAGPVAVAALPDATALGVIEIAVRDLGTMTGFYRDVIGLSVLEESDQHAVLGRESALIRLTSTDAAADDPTSAGLYHSAILFADAPSLARTLVSVATNAPELYQGSADHAVSLAFYMADPEGNGIELYIDRPREEWVWEDGLVVMGSAALDPNQFIDENLAGDASGTATVGHVHLRVGDLAEARAFYADTLGFDVTAEADGALFYSAGGYHHHIATNTWMSEGAGVRGESAGLSGITVAVPAASDLDDLSGRLTDAGIEHTAADGMVVTADPWGNTVRFVLN